LVNKKAQIAGALTDFYAYAFFAVIFIIYLILFFIIAEKPTDFRALQSNISSLDAGISLNSFLRIPIEDQTMAELIMKGQNDNKTRANIAINVREIFKKLNFEKETKLLIVYPTDKKRPISIKYSSDGISLQEKGLIPSTYIFSGKAKTTIPSIDGRTIQIELTNYGKKIA